MGNKLLHIRAGFLFLFLASTAAAQESAGNAPAAGALSDTVIITAASARIYAVPKEGAASTGAAAASAVFPVISRIPGWYEVRYMGRSGWIREGYARPKGRDAIVQRKRVSRRSAIDSILITSDLGELFSEPDRNARSLGYAPRNTVLPLYSARVGFFETAREGETGWIWQGQARRVSQTAAATADAPVAQKALPGDSARIWTAADIVSEPAEGASFIATARQGMMLPVLARQGEWIKIDYRGAPAWIKGSACVKPPEEKAEKAPAAIAPRSTARAVNKNPRITPAPAAASDSAVKPAEDTVSSATASPVQSTPVEVPEKPVDAVVKANAFLQKIMHRQDANPVWLVLVVLLSFAGSGVIFMMVRRVLRQRSSYKSLRSTTLRARRKCLIVSKKNKYVQSYMLDMPTTLRHCFEEIGFMVFKAVSLEEARAMSAMSAFEIVLVDWRLCQNGLASAAQLSTAYGSKGPRNHVIVYNVPNLDRIDENRTSAVHVLGVLLTDRDVFSMVTSRILNAKAAQKSLDAKTVTHALDGEIEHTPLSETFQFMEISKKTGCLLVERDGPFGMAYFLRGRIVFASSPSKTGESAILEILDMKQGKFHFIGDQTTEQKNCDCSALGILMEWAYTRDEAARGKKQGEGVRGQ